MSKERLSTIDYIRTLSIFPIVHFHLTDLVYYQDKMSAELFYQPHKLMYDFSRYMSFSGFTIVYIFCFLLGFNFKESASLKNTKMKIMFAGLIALAAVYYFAYQSEAMFEWDIYHFLVLSFLALSLLKSKFNFRVAELALFGLLACIPFWTLEVRTSLAGVFFGNCDLDGTGLWPVFPNIFFVFFGFSLGGFMRINFHKLSERASALLLTVGTALVAFASLSHFSLTPIGPGFGCYIHRPSALVWVALVLGLTAVFVGGSGKQLNQRVQAWRFSSSLKKLAWNRSFGMCYLVQWAFLMIIYANRDLVIAHPKYYFILPIAVLALTEHSVRQVSKFSRNGLSG